jgi:hypothetical protein
MICKNCETSLRTDYLFCPRCGAKVTARRLTFRNLFADILERFFDLDNTFYRTLKTMTIRPEEVIGSYIEGVRRRYLNPMSYLGIALGLSGFLFFLMKQVGDSLSFDILEAGNSEASRKIMDASMEYSTFVFLLFIPIIALSGYLSFNRRGYNLPEQLVSAIYTLAHISVITFPFSVIILLAIPEKYMIYALWNIVLMLAFNLFVLIRLHRYPLGITFIRTLLFSFLFLIGYFGLGILMNIIALLTGVVTLEELMTPPPPSF